MLIGWGVSGIFTACGLLEGNDLARTDIGHEAIADAKWFYFPYPGIKKSHFNEIKIPRSLYFSITDYN